MSQPAFEMINGILDIWKLAIQTVMFLVLWAAVFRERKRRRDGIAALLFILANIGIGLLPCAVWTRYTATVVIVAVYCIVCKREIRKAVFTAFIFYNFHNLSYMIANSIYVKSVDFFLDNMGTLQENYQQQVYRCLSAGRFYSISCML